MKILVPMANGFEEMETTIIVDVFRRAGWTVTVAGIAGMRIRGSRGMTMIPDKPWEEVVPKRFDALVLPGGWDGAMALCIHGGVQEALRGFSEEGKWIGAICAAPLALQSAGILAGRRFTCHPSVEKHLPKNSGRLADRVVVDENLITSQGPGTAFEFVLRFVEVAGKAPLAAKLRGELLLD